MNPRFHVAPDDATLATGATVQLPERAAAHAARVLRLEAGATVTLFDGGGAEFDARIAGIARGRVTAEVLDRHEVARESPLAITLYQGVARGERMDLIVQKSTELGVGRIVPLLTARTTVRLDAEGAEKRLDHWRGVAASACEQCGRNVLPQIDAPVKFSVGLSASTETLRLLLDPDGDTSLRALPLATGSSIALLIGPEGGLDETERASAQTRGFQRCRMGPRVLRTETAPLAALAALQALAGDLG